MVLFVLKGWYFPLKPPNWAKLVILGDFLTIGQLLESLQIYNKGSLVKYFFKLDVFLYFQFQANFYLFLEAAIAFLLTFIGNLCITSIFAQGLNGKTNQDVSIMFENLIKLNVH